MRRQTCLQTDRQLDRQTDGRRPERSTSVKLLWSTSRGAKMSTVRNDPHCAKWLGYEMTRIRNDWKWSVCRWTCMPLFSRGAMCIPLTTRKISYVPCLRILRRELYAAPHCSVMVLVSSSKTKVIMTNGRWRAPLFSNMLQNSCRNRIVSYTVARWSYYVVLIPY